MPDGFLQRLPPARAALGLLPERFAVSRAENDPAPKDRKEHQESGPIPSIFDEWMHHWIDGRRGAPRPADSEVRPGSKGDQR